MKKKEINKIKKIITNPLFIILILIVISLLIRIPIIYKQAIDVDEYYSYLAAKGIVLHGLPQLPSGMVYTRALLASYLNAGFLVLIGDSIESMRFLSLIFSILLIPLTYLVGKRLFNKNTGLLAAAFVTLFRFEHFYATNARMYMQLQFLFLLTIYLFYLGFEENKTRYKYLVLLPFIAGLFTHQLMLMFIPPIFLYLFLTKKLGFLKNKYNLFSLVLLLLSVLFTYMLSSNIPNQIYIPEGYSWDLAIGFSLTNFNFSWVITALIEEMPFILIFFIIGLIFLFNEKNKKLLFFYTMSIVVTVLTTLYINQKVFRYYFETLPIYIIIISYVIIRLFLFLTKTFTIQKNGLAVNEFFTKLFLKYGNTMAFIGIIAGLIISVIALAYDFIKRNEMKIFSVNQAIIALAGLGLIVISICSIKQNARKYINKLIVLAVLIFLIFETGLYYQILPINLVEDLHSHQYFAGPYITLSEDFVTFLRSNYQENDKIIYMYNSIDYQIRPLAVNYEIRQRNIEGEFKTFENNILDPYLGVLVIDSKEKLEEILAKENRTWIIVDEFVARLSDDFKNFINNLTPVFIDPENPEIKLILVSNRE